MAALSSRRIDVPADQDVNEFLYQQGFSDGLPVVAPTEARVRAMLSGTTRLPSEALGKVPPNHGVATVEKVAVAAVMAGCLPRHFRVVIAAVEALLDKDFNVHGLHATTMGATPCVIVSGPVRKEAGLNMKHGALSSGNRANAVIGRTLKLVMQNIGGARLGGTESTTLGTPMKFTMCVAEWEERGQDWEPYHVTRGFKKEDSVVTVLGVTSGPHQMVDMVSDADRFLSLMSDGLSTSYNTGAPWVNEVLLVISPEHYDTLRKGGVASKKELRHRLWHLTNRTMAYRLGGLVAQQLRLRIGRIAASIVGALVGAVASLYATVTRRGFSSVSKFLSPESFHIVVAGAPAGKFSSFCPGFGIMKEGPMAKLSQAASRKVDRAPADMAEAPAASGSERVLLDPTGELKVEKLVLAERTGMLSGTVGLLDISKPRGSELLDRLQQKLVAQYPGVKVRRYSKPTFSRPAPASLIDEIARTCAFVVTALAD